MVDGTRRRRGVVVAGLGGTVVGTMRRGAVPAPVVVDGVGDAPGAGTGAVEVVADCVGGVALWLLVPV